MNKTESTWHLLVLIGFIMAGCSSAHAASQVVWQIGKFNKSSMEFSGQAPWTVKPKIRMTWFTSWARATRRTGPVFSRGHQIGGQAIGRILTPSNLIYPPTQAAYTR